MSDPRRMAMPDPDELAPQRNRVARRWALFLLISTTVVVLSYLFIWWRDPSPQNAQLFWTTPLPVFMLLGLGLVWRKRTTAGMVVICFTAMGSGMLTPFLVGGLGLALGVGMVLTLLIITVQTLPRRPQLIIIGGAIIASFITVVFDLFPLNPNRLDTAAVGAGLSVTVAIALLAVFGVVLRNFRNYSLQVKLVIAFVTLVAFASGAITLAVNLVVRASYTQQAGEQLQALAQAQGEVLGGVIIKHIEALQALAINESVQNALETELAQYPADPVEAQRQINERAQAWRTAADTDPLVLGILRGPLQTEFREFQEVFPDHIELFITDRYGATVSAATRPEQYAHAQDDWWQAAYAEGAGEIYVGLPSDRAGLSQIGVIIALPVYQHEGAELVGVLRSTITFDEIAEILNAAQFGDTGHIDLWLGGDDLYDSEAAAPRAVDAALLAHLQALIKTRLPSPFEFEGRPNLVAGHPVFATDAEEGPVLETLSWNVIAHASPTEVLRPAEITVNLIILIGMVAMGGAVLLAVIFARQLSAPILRLTHAAREIENGNLDARIVVASQDEIGQLGVALERMTTRLKDTAQNAQRRAEALAASARVSRALSTILEPQRLSAVVVEELQNAFGYYHAHIFLVDSASQTLYLAGGTGEAGRAMLARRHTIPLGKGVVGRAAQTNQTVLSPDVTRDPGWLFNPLLPQTRAELAAPIVSGDQVLGVLDVQSSTPGGLTQDDAELLRAVADQLAVAVRNAQIYAQAERQAERRAVAVRVNQRIQTATTPQEVIDTAARELGLALGARQTVVELKPPQRASALPEIPSKTA